MTRHLGDDSDEDERSCSASRRQTRSLMIEGPALWAVLAGAWFLALCFVPDPRPLGAPEWSVRWLQSLTRFSEPNARVAATFALRATGFVAMGLLTSLSLSSLPLSRAAPLAMVLGPLLTVLSQWINYQHFPIALQLMLSIPSALVGVLIGGTLRRNAWSLAALAVVAGGLILYGTATGIPDALDDAARMFGERVLADAHNIPDGDDGFAAAMAAAFAYAEDNSHGASAVKMNKAAILALGTLLGEEQVARVAQREIDASRQDEINALRNRITLRGRHDLPRHFWVSAALTVLSDAERSTAVGVAKELRDSTPGGSGFSFVDLAANRAGILFALAATSSERGASETQIRISRGVNVDDFCPEVTDLPEGFSRDEFQELFGGVGGAKSREVFDEIERRMAACQGLAVQSP